MLRFRAVEFDRETVLKTGREEIYVAKDKEAAVKSCLYTHSLSNGDSFVGPTGAVVHSGNSSWSVVEDKKSSGEFA